MRYFDLTKLQEIIAEKSGWSVSMELNDPTVLKYNRCMTPTDVVAVDANYEADIVDGNWDYRLDSLTDGKNLFDGVTTLESFNVDLPNLTNGYRMFSGCDDLVTFKGSLPNLTNGYQMFEGCRLDAQSVANILKDINDVSQIPNGESYTADVYKTIDIDGYAAGWEAYNNFHHDVAINAGKSSWAELESEVEAKGWTLRVTCSSDHYYD